MKRLHFEFDAVVTDKSAKELLEAYPGILEDNIGNALEIFDDNEEVYNLKITENDSNES